MSYQRALEAAGARVLAFEEFGDYQGTWWALVEHDDSRGWISGSYGSCSGCDAFLAEFGWEDEETPEKLAEFGRGYLGGELSQEAAEAEASRNLDWDSEAEKVISFIRKNPA